MKTLIRATALASAIAFSIATAAAAQPAAPDPARLSLAREVLEATGGAKAAEAQIRSVYGTIMTGMAKDQSPEVAHLSQLMMQDTLDEVAKVMPTIVDVSARAYAKNLTEQELRDMLAFYRSESGQSLLHKLPVIMQQAMAEEMPMLQAMTPNIMKKALDHVCEEAKCTPEVRQIMAAAVAKATNPPAS